MICWKKIIVLLLVSSIYYLVSSSVSAQTMESDDVIVEIENIELKTSDQPADTPQPPEQFRRQGYLIQSIDLDQTISRPFALAPAAYLIRVKPGSTFSLPVTIYNFKDPAVLQSNLIPFTEDSTGQQISIDCSKVQVASCLGLDWLSLPEALQENLFIEAGDQQQFKLRLRIPVNAPEGDNYLKLQLSEFQKPYHYTSTDVYITIIKSGIIDHNISIDKMFFQSDAFNFFESVAFIDSRDKPLLAIKVSNGSPYFLPAAITLKIRSPLGFEVNRVLAPKVLLANQKKTITTQLQVLPLGLATTTAVEGAGSASISFIALPYLGYIIGGVILIPIIIVLVKYAAGLSTHQLNF